MWYRERLFHSAIFVLALTLAAMPGTTAAYPQGLILYDGFDDEAPFARTETVAQLDITPDFGPDGVLRYFEPGYWGSGATTASYLNFIPDGRFGVGAGFNYSGSSNGWASHDGLHYPVGSLMTPEEGTIEFWYRPHFDENDTSAVMQVISGFKSRLDLPLTTYYERSRSNVAQLYWAYHGWSGRHYWTFGIVEYGATAQDVNYHVMARTPPESSPERFRFEAEEWMHVGLSWKSDGIPGHAGKTLVMFINGVEVASSVETYTPREAFDPHLAVGSSLGQSFVPSLPGNNYSGASGDIDELRIWDFAKTDFSDRFSPLRSGSMVDVASVADLNRNGTPELATLRVEADGSVLVIVRDSETKELISEIGFDSAGRTPLALTGIVDSTGPGIAVLFRKPNGQGVVHIRDALTGQWVHQLYFFGELWEVEAISSHDSDGDGVSEIAVLGNYDDGSRAAIQVKDAETREKVNWIELSIE
jgi:hypothetical protein